MNNASGEIEIRALAEDELRRAVEIDVSEDGSAVLEREPEDSHMTLAP